MKIKFGDILIIVLVLFFAFILFFTTLPSGDTVFIEVEGKVIKQLSLKKDEEFVYEGRYTNNIKVSDGVVYIAKSDCPDNTCVHTGAINSSQKVICCLPNHLVIRVAKNNNHRTDVISG